MNFKYGMLALAPLDAQRETQAANTLKPTVAMPKAPSCDVEQFILRRGWPTPPSTILVASPTANLPAYCLHTRSTT